MACRGPASTATIQQHPPQNPSTYANKRHPHVIKTADDHNLGPPLSPTGRGADGCISADAVWQACRRAAAMQPRGHAANKGACVTTSSTPVGLHVGGRGWPVLLDLNITNRLGSQTCSRTHRADLIGRPQQVSVTLCEFSI